jgi:hypothetical protein
MIFDEIDRGVGGAVAQAIGERLARLASSGQLLAVTHSPQVAARGDSIISSPRATMALSRAPASSCWMAQGVRKRLRACCRARKSRPRRGRRRIGCWNGCDLRKFVDVWVLEHRNFNIILASCIL